jgi:glycosyltransferase involved in cell wall biosynthesis
MSFSRLSVVIPVLNERESLPGLLDELELSCSPLGLDWEVIVVDDGSSDGSFGLVGELAADRPWLGALRLRTNYGKSAALAAGFDASTGDVIVTIDGDGQDDPADIPALLEALEAGSDLVSGWKVDRRDPLGRRLASRVFNGVTSRISGQRLHDMNCGLKAYRGECARSLELYGDLHRFVAVLAAQEGWRVSELPVNHRPRNFGSSKFGRERYLRGALDLLTVTFLGRWQHRPLHLFGTIGVAFFAIGVAISIYLTVLKLTGESIGERPLLFLGLLLIIVGVQLLSLGLVGQLLLVVSRRDGAPPTARISSRTGSQAVGPPAADGSARSATETTPAR